MKTMATLAIIASVMLFTGCAATMHDNVEQEYEPRPIDLATTTNVDVPELKYEHQVPDDDDKVRYVPETKIKADARFKEAVAKVALLNLDGDIKKAFKYIDLGFGAYKNNGSPGYDLPSKFANHHDVYYDVLLYRIKNSNDELVNQYIGMAGKIGANVTLDDALNHDYPILSQFPEYK